MQLLASILPAAAQTTAVKAVPHIDFGNTAWIIVATALVMFMTIPGLALFYGGLVRRKNILEHPDAVFCNNGDDQS